MASKEVLENGTAIQAMVNRYIEEPSELRMFQLLDCLTDCQVAIPCNMRISDEDFKKFENSSVGDEISPENDIGFTPDNLITPDGHRYIPIFSNESKADPEYIKHFSVLHLYISDFIKLYDDIKGEAEGLLLDYDMGFRGEYIEILKKICADKEDGSFYKNEEKND